MKVKGISYSSDRKLRRCEQQYSYRYDEKLKPRLKSKGLYMGDVIHRLLDSYRKGEDWRNTFEMWKRQEWNRLFEEEREMYEEKKMTPDLVLDLVSHYVDYWSEQQAKWEPLFIEKEFILTTKSGLPIRFKSDYIVKEGKLTILVENKTGKKIPNVEERMLAPQVHAYCYLLSRLPDPIRIDRIVWDYIRTDPVPMPEITKKGLISKRKIDTDQRHYLRFLKEQGIHPKDIDEMTGIHNTVGNLPETIQLLRVPNKPNLKLGEMFVREWVERANRAKLIKKPLRNWGRDCKWGCDYFELCQADMLGKPDRNTIIKKNFVYNIKGASDAAN